MWIRDGVLVNRMHVNPVAFAFSYFLFIAGRSQTEISLEQLINFGFEKSGLSASEKMQLFAQQHGGALENLAAAASFYNRLASAVAVHCRYFDGAVQLLAALHAAGVRNFITSAVEQSVLDDWIETPQGAAIRPWLTEILGKRQDFSKGRDHFQHVATLCGNGPIYCVADAVSEIAVARKYSDDFHITPTGFAYVVGREQVLTAVKQVQQSLVSLDDCRPQSAQISDEWDSAFRRLASAKVEADALSLLDASAIELSLKSAGASRLALGAEDKIMDCLREIFHEFALL
jgi:phosphoglycolate phosphatase-like HAD superfamily hydrolase